MLLKESDLRRIVRSVIKEQNSVPVLDDKEQKIANDIISAVLQAKKSTVLESSFKDDIKDIGSSIVDIGFRLFSFKATIPMISSAIIMYCQHKQIQPDALTIQHAQMLVKFIGLKGNHALEIIMNVIAGIGGTYGVVKGAKALDALD
tara:strand:- start:370 stop:810 length:441 start_codon:yes stop_codon:yes gene_type:complete